MTCHVIELQDVEPRDYRMIGLARAWLYGLYERLPDLGAHASQLLVVMQPVEGGFTRGHPTTLLHVPHLVPESAARALAETLSRHFGAATLYAHVEGGADGRPVPDQARDATAVFAQGTDITDILDG